MGDLKFSPEVEASPEHHWYGWRVPADHQSREAASDLLRDPKFQNLAADLGSRGGINFEREILLAQREGRVETMTPRQPGSQNIEAPDSSIARDRR